MHDQSFLLDNAPVHFIDVLQCLFLGKNLDSKRCKGEPSAITDDFWHLGAHFHYFVHLRNQVKKAARCQHASIPRLRHHVEHASDVRIDIVLRGS